MRLVFLRGTYLVHASYNVRGTAQSTALGTVVLLFGTTSNSSLWLAEKPSSTARALGSRQPNHINE